MVFGFFSRKPAATTTAAVVEAGPSIAEDDAISPQFKFPPPQVQLHTPSPSIDSTALLLAEKPKPKPKPRARPKPKPKPVEPKHASPDIVPPDTPSPPPEYLTVPVTDPTALYALVSSVPAQTLHTYTLAHLSPVPPSPFPFTALPGPPPIAPPTTDVLTALTTFFSSLAPPPKLHCVRCHRGYFELENADTACRIPHDDDSAIVERVGLTRGADAGYETLWGCCAKTVDGDGDMGPPDGWCYEGAHTTDTKRARFRADSTPQHDKLTSCLAMRCHMPPLPPRSSRASASRKRNRRVMEDADEQHEDDARSVASSQHTHTRSHSHSISIPVSRNAHARTRSVSSMSKGKARVCYPKEGADKEEEEEEEEEPRRPAKRVRARKSSVFAGAASSRLRKEEEEEGTSEENENDDDADAMDVDMPPPPPPISPPRSPPKRKYKPTPKAAAAAAAAAAASATASPPRSPPKRDQMNGNGRKALPRGGSPTPTSMARAMMVKRVEVEIVSRSPPKTGGKPVSRVASVASLRGKKEKAEKEKAEQEKTKMLGEIVDTSVDGEGWS